MIRRAGSVLTFVFFSFLSLPISKSAGEGSAIVIQPRARMGSGPVARAPDIRVDTNLVLINVSVTDPLNRFVTGMEKENFRLFEDRKEQQVIHFAMEDTPLTVGLVFDTSGSMGAKLGKAREAVFEFLKIANPADEFFLVEFNDRPSLARDLTPNVELIRNRLTFTQSKGGTALLDAVYMSVHHMKKAHNPRKALLIISDGGDNGSRYSENQIRNLI